MLNFSDISVIFTIYIKVFIEGAIEGILLGIELKMNGSKEEDLLGSEHDPLLEEEKRNTDRYRRRR